MCFVTQKFSVWKQCFKDLKICEFSNIKISNLLLFRIMKFSYFVKIS
jgi:hypothetical protein